MDSDEPGEGPQNRLAPEQERPRILVVEDDYLSARLLEESLEGEGYAVVGPVSQLDEAMALAESQSLDAALLDVSIGGQAVFPVAQLLRERDIPFVFLTGHRREVVPREYEARMFIRKPFPLGSLLQAIQNLTAGSRQKS